MTFIGSSSSTSLVVIFLLVILASIASLTESFSAVASSVNRSRSHFLSSSSKYSTARRSPSPLYAFANILRRSSSGDSSSRNKNNEKTTAATKQQQSLKLINGDDTILHITDITDYKNRVVDEKHNITVVRFYSHYCRSCRASEPHFFKLAREFQMHNVNFVEVPLTPSTKVLHDALGVPSLPWTHIYHPYAGLVEERKVSKKFIEDVRKCLRCYVYGECDLEDAPHDCMEVYGECAIDDDDASEEIVDNIGGGSGGSMIE